jgi:4-amino-4-deoxy-L-arabinose transferase-like glycosyltransferase
MKRLYRFMPASILFAFALGIRVLYNVTVARRYTPTHDAFFYQTIGFNALHVHCYCLHLYYPTVNRAPLWPALIALISLPFGPSDFYARLFFCMLGAGTCVFVYLFAKALTNNIYVGLLAGIIAAVYPGLFIYDGWLYTESLYTLLLFALCYTVYSLQHTPRRYKWAICGILLGLLSLARPNGPAVLVLLILWGVFMAWRKVFSWSFASKGLLISTLIAVAIIAPWTVRNYEVSQSFVSVASGDGIVLLGAYNDQIVTNPDYAGSWINPNVSSPAVAKQFPLYTCDARCEVKQDVVYTDAAKQWVLHHLGAMPKLLLLHFTNMWTPVTVEADLPTSRFPNTKSSQLVVDWTKLIAPCIFVLAALGILALWQRRRDLLFVYFILLLTIAQNLVFYGSPRFRAPIEPILVLLAAGSLWFLWSMVVKLRHRKL